MRARLADDLSTQVGQRLIAAWLESFGNERIEVQRKRNSGYNYYEKDVDARAIERQVTVAESFYITENMLLLADHARHSMPTLGLQRHDMPAEAGFLWLPRSIVHYDVRGRALGTRAILWHPYHAGVAITMWTDRDDPNDEVNADVREQWYANGGQAANGLAWEQTPKLQLQHMLWLRWGDDLPTYPNTENMHRWRGLLGSVEFQPNFTDDGITWEVTGTEMDVMHAKALMAINPVEEEPEPVVGFLAAFARLCGQSITVAEKEPLDRATRRRWQKRIPNIDAITVINLRHNSVEREPGESQVEWSHRWLRRGHWRRQWYGSGEDRYQSPVYINETVCGPEDKPLVVKQHVTSLSR